MTASFIKPLAFGGGYGGGSDQGLIPGPAAISSTVASTSQRQALCLFDLWTYGSGFHMPLILRLILVLLLMSLPASAHFGLGGHGGPGSVVQTIASVPLSNNSFSAGSSSGTVVGIVGTPVMSPSSPAFSGSCCTLSGADAASFQIVG